MCRRVLTRVFARRIIRFVTPSNHRGYLRLAKALIRLLRSADVQSQSVQADPSLRTSFIVGFAMHRLMRELFVQTLTLSTLGTIISRRHFEIFFLFFQENIICTSCKLSPLHETSNPVFLVMKRKQEAHGPRVAHLSDIATADMQMLCNIFPILSSQLMKRSSFKQFFILKKKIYGIPVN